MGRSSGDGLIIGVDGEGEDTPDGRHIYTYLCAKDEHGNLVADAYNANGLSHEECVAMLLKLPPNALKFGYMFSYDTTKIIEQMPLLDRYYLVRPDLREAKRCNACHQTKMPLERTTCSKCHSTDLRKYNKPVSFAGRKYNFFNGALTISRGKQTTKIWDCFRFFGGPFVDALKNWKVGTPEQIARIEEMKQKRGAFNKETAADIMRYCQEECHLLAVMMRKVIEAHIAAGMILKSYHGAGSTATALLGKNNVSDHKGTSIHDMPAGLSNAIASAFFGGRFENATIGFVKKKTHSFDISSAYPFALCQLPCLKCGSWKRVTNLTPKRLREEIEVRGNLAVARFTVREVSEKERRVLAWGPLPCRDAKGSICYGVNFSGWAWGPELLSALDGWGELVELSGEAWIYEPGCTDLPFGFLPEGYRMRILWGKEGRGLTLKLGINASYGKTAQAIGDDPPFQSWVWAGMTTSMCRAQLLNAIASAKNRWNVLAVATDGIYATEKLPIGPPPKDTGTGDMINDKGERVTDAPLGGWEYKEVPEGIFIVKPGLYYRLKADIAEVRARGIGRREFYGNRKRIERAFSRWDRVNMRHAVRVQGRRFYGAKHSITCYAKCTTCKKTWPGVPEQRCPKCKQLGDEQKVTLTSKEDGSPAYGTWGLRTIDIGFNPYPKRENTDLEKGGRSLRLHVRDLGGIVSKPYDVGSRKTTPEGETARQGRDFELEQPDWNG